MSECQALIRSRFIPQHKNESGVEIASQWKALPSPEPCGAPGREYKVRQRARTQRKRKIGPWAKDQHVLLMPLALPIGSMTINQSLCERHKKKAEREGMECLAL